MKFLKKIIKKIWSDCEEEGIHNCIIEAYNSQNFIVDHIHKTRSRSENGIDISCEKKGHKIIFQIKKSPKANDIKQLKIFSKQEADKRIYVYINAPTTDFKKEMKKLKNEVCFWDRYGLHEILVEHDSFSYLHFIFQNTELVDNLTKALKIFVDSRSVDFKSTTKLTNDQHNMLWRLKDDSVKLKACLELCQMHWEGEVNNETSTDPVLKKKILESILLNLEQINDITGSKILSTFELCKKRHPMILSYGYHVSIVELRSNWLLFPGREGQSSMNNSKNLEKAIKNWFTYSESQYGFFSELISILDTLEEGASAIEDFINWTFEDYNKTHLIR